MTTTPTARGSPFGSAVLRAGVEDFRVDDAAGCGRRCARKAVARCRQFYREATPSCKSSNELIGFVDSVATESRCQCARQWLVDSRLGLFPVEFYVSDCRGVSY